MPKLYDDENGADPRRVAAVPVVVTVSVKGAPLKGWAVTVYEIVPVTDTVVEKLVPKAQLMWYIL